MVSVQQYLVQLANCRRYVAKFTVLEPSRNPRWHAVLLAHPDVQLNVPSLISCFHFRLKCFFISWCKQPPFFQSGPKYLFCLNVQGSRASFIAQITMFPPFNLPNYFPFQSLCWMFACPVQSGSSSYSN